MGGLKRHDQQQQKKRITGATERPFTTGLFLLRCVQLGLTMADLEYLDVGMVYDLMIENENDGEEWARIATQADFDNF